MAIHIKTPEEIEKMRVAGRLAAEVLHMIKPHVQAGVTTDELDQICHDYIVNEQHAIPAPLNYNGFPKSICTSVNHQVCHGIPSDKRLKDGDIINIDITVIKDGFHGDTSKMFFVGSPSILASRISRISHECMKLGIEMVKPGARLGDIGYAIQKHAESKLFGGAGVLWPRHRQTISRRASSATLWQSGHRCHPGSRYDVYHRTYDQCRQTQCETTT